MNQKLKERTKTAILFGIVVLGLILSHYLTAVLFLWLVAALAGAELVFITSKKYTKTQSYIISFVFNILVFLVIYKLSQDSYDFFLGMSAAFMTFFIALIYYKGETKFMKFSLFFMFSYISLPLALMARYIIEFPFEPFSMNLLLIILLLIWASDSFAYLIGSRIGKTKLMERISPNKTWEGYFGGGIMAIIVGIALSYASAYSMQAMIIFALIAWIIGTYGDLFESSIKRKQNIKDSGDILPGHGGFLDRFDSFIFVIPFVLSIIYFYNY